MKSIVGLTLLSIFFLTQDTGTIKGRIVPYNAALNVWAVSENDTVKTTVKSAGEFELKTKPGRYRIIIEGHRPYKTTTKPDVVVGSGAYIDIGDIKLDEGTLISSAPEKKF